ncbi:hypothetical protein AGDE_00368 [Angomonas deanei]|uniref:WD domain, G-beta repeat, putative n=1 Tax=Angomonas deanei TaxID=59799 RepID=A0A7G2CF72_9TRYP|nr:hypothetical protein AGDE_00368 [Angomonas deanei]CAD2218189.1 WD domain, G-beta repeat, putative [Angomonas deanei]|eukprot:EPY43553.1 hypothetical protein AGDE_00368 [Angomonas deanei]
MRNIKTLYNKNFGHTEWVTCCRCLSDGRIVSGGMDNKVCLWDSFLKNTGNANNLMSLEGEILYDQSSPARCVELLGHSSTISKVEVNAANTLLLSSSYDRSLRLYKIPMFNISAKRKESAVLANAHKSAITHFNWNYNFVLSGDKKGILKIWDLQQAQSTHTFATKKGALTALRAVYMPTAFMNHGEEVEEAGGTPLIAAYGDEVGALTIADVRTRNSQKVFSDIVHPGGSLTEIQFLFNNHYYDTNDQVYHAPDENTGNYSYIPQVVTCGADKKIKILEPRKNFQPLHTFEDHRDFIYSLNVLNHYNRRENRFQNIIFSGDGEGNVLFSTPMRESACMD